MGYKSLPLAATFLLAFLLLNFVSAFTVTLTGTCQREIVNNTLNFTISSTGNGTVYNLVFSPFVPNATVVGNYSLASLAPGTSNSIYIKLENVTAKGSYAAYVLLAYQQSSDFFTALFPCLVNFGNVVANSNLFISAKYTFLNSTVAVVNATVFNAERTPIMANVSVLLPPAIKTIGPSSQLVSLSPYNSTNVYFKLLDPVALQQALSIGVYAAYSNSGLHYASLSAFALSGTASAKKSGVFLLLAISFIILIVLILLIFSLIKSRKKAREQHQHHGV